MPGLIVYAILSFFQISINKLLGRHFQMLCIPVNTFRWNASFIHLTAVPAFAAIIVSKKFFK